MELFNDMQDVEEWLGRMDYGTFWREVQPFALALQSRESCDAQIAGGKVKEALVLEVLKGMARLELVERFRLGPRIAAPWHRLH